MTLKGCACGCHLEQRRHSTTPRRLLAAQLRPNAYAEHLNAIVARVGNINFPTADSNTNREVELAVPGTRRTPLPQEIPITVEHLNASVEPVNNENFPKPNGNILRNVELAVPGT